ncbi:esterase/lipase family protein [Tomitella biformata]|uniref:esterase/lipase family protein n=1 Tax=Tomitella biformata TaxID=630403 RepID=UPI0004B589D2|nr:hypothetical protein [Tomitella biformata]
MVRSRGSKRRPWLGAAVSALLLTGTLLAGGAQAAVPTCPATVVLIHDMARDAGEWDSTAEVLRAAGWCVEALTYGEPLGPFAGRGALDSASGEVGAAIEETLDRAGPVVLVGHGAGSLAAQRHLQRAPSTSGIAALITLGPLWNGTNIGELATMERISREVGAYDAVLELERPIVDPVCAGCRDLIAGSDFLVDLRRDGLVTAGVEYTNIASRTGLLEQPPLAGLAPEMAGVIVQDRYPSNTATHFGLADDPDVQVLLLEALAEVGS